MVEHVKHITLLVIRYTGDITESCCLTEVAILCAPDVAVGRGGTTGVCADKTVGSDIADAEISAVGEIVIVDILSALCLIFRILNKYTLIRSAKTGVCTYCVNPISTTVQTCDRIRCGELLLNLVIVRAENIVTVDDCQIGILAGGRDGS